MTAATTVQAIASRTQDCMEASDEWFFRARTNSFRICGADKTVELRPD